MLIGNLPEDTTPSNNGYIPYSEDGQHLSKISRENFIKGAGHGTNMIYWDEGDGQVVMDGTHTNIPRTVIGSLYSYAIEDDGNAYWFAIYPSTYWSAEITGEVRKVWELAFEEGGEINYIAYMDNQGNVYVRGSNYAGATLETLKARNFVYVDEDGVETDLMEYFMTKFDISDGLYFGEEGGAFEDTLFAIGATQISINGMNFQLQNDDGSFDLDFGGEFMYTVYGNNVRGLTVTGNRVSDNITFTNSTTHFVPHKSLFYFSNSGYPTPLTEAYGSTDNVMTTPFLPDRLYYYDAPDDSYANQELNNAYIFNSYKRVPINAAYGLTLTDGDVYLVGSYNSSGYFVLDSTLFTQTLPTSENGLVYILIGTMANDLLDFQINRPKYWYKDGAIRPYSYIPTIETPLSDIYYLSNGQEHSYIGTNGKFGLVGSDTVSIGIGSSSGTGHATINVNSGALAPNLPTNEMAPSTSLTAQPATRYIVYNIPLGFAYQQSSPYPYVYLNTTVIIRKSDSSTFTAGNVYKTWLGPSSSINYDPFPYENGEGGYFRDSKVALSGDTEIVLQFSGIFKLDNYSVSSAGGLLVILEIESASSESLSVYTNIEATKINTPSS